MIKNYIVSSSLGQFGMFLDVGRYKCIIFQQFSIYDVPDLTTELFRFLLHQQGEILSIIPTQKMILQMLWTVT